MSHENKRKRMYVKKERARQEAQTRLRITEALVELHRRVGPVNTTISEVADLAGVGRMTVYKHFPDEVDMYAACSAHWSEQNPLPSFDDCLKLDEMEARCACVLTRLYNFYRDNYDMLGKIIRDAPAIPALKKVVDRGWSVTLEELGQALLPPERTPAKRSRMLAMIRLVLDLHTWELLTRNLSDAASAKLAARMVANVYKHD